MLSVIFLSVIKLSVSGALLIAAAALLRLVFRRVPRAVFCVIWVLIALRLVVPFSLESRLSLVPAKYSQEAIGEAVTEYVSEEAWLSGGREAVAKMHWDQAEPEAIFEGAGNLAPDHSAENVYVFGQDRTDKLTAIPEEAQADKLLTPLDIASYAWLAGAAAMLAYAVFSYVKLRRRVAASVRACGDDNIYICDDIDGAFILGLLQPRIYLSSAMSEADRGAVIAHEKAHLARFDHLVKPLFFAVLALHWFNPFVWAAYAMLCRDIEFACDERVLRGLEPAGVKAYSNALLACGSGRFRLSASPLAFGETGVRERVKAALRYRKPTLWVITAAALCVLLFAGCTVSRPASYDQNAANQPVSAPEDGQTASTGSAAEISESQQNNTPAAITGSDSVKPSPGAERVYKTADGVICNDLQSYLHYIEGDMFEEAGDGSGALLPGRNLDTYEVHPWQSDWDGYAWGLAERISGEVSALHRVDIGAAGLNENTCIYRVEVPAEDSEDRTVDGVYGSGDAYNIWYMVTYTMDTVNGDRIGPKLIGLLPFDAMNQYTSREWIEKYYSPARAAAMDVRSSYLLRFSYDSENKNPWFITGAEYDIDGDGEVEKVSVTLGTTSGVLSFVVTISGEQGMEYQSFFTSMHGEIELKEMDGSLKLTLQPRKGGVLSDEIYVYDIIPEGGRVKLVGPDGAYRLDPVE